jgi:hypothetical protein
MDRSNEHREEASPPGGSGSSKKLRKRSSQTKDPNAMTEAEFRREAARIWARAGKMTLKERLAAAEAVRGSWANRPEWKGMSGVQIAAELRKSAMGRTRHG